MADVQQKLKVYPNSAVSGVHLQTNEIKMIKYY